MNPTIKSKSTAGGIALLDKLAISGSAICAAHCLLTPLLILVLPSLGSSFLGNEEFHFWLVVLIIPTSLLALGLGCKKHGFYRVIFIGLFGLSLLIMAILVEHIFHSHLWEKILTLIGSLIIATAHFENYKRCHKG